MVPGIGPLVANTLFPPKQDTFRPVFDYRPVNLASVIPHWPIHDQWEVFDNILPSGYGVFFQADEAHGFWGVSMTLGDIWKAAVITLHG